MVKGTGKPFKSFKIFGPNPPVGYGILVCIRFEKMTGENTPLGKIRISKTFVQCMYTQQTRDLRFNKTNYDHDISIYTMLHSLISSRCRYKKFANALLNLNAVTYFHKSIYNSVSFTCNKQMKSMLLHQNSFYGSNTLFEKKTQLSM